MMRIERDLMGEAEIPDDALWSAQTQRAVENFPISGLCFGRCFIQALGWVKWACAQANMDLELLDDRLGAAIVRACDEVIEGKRDDQFPVDIFQTGSGTSTKMMPLMAHNLLSSIEWMANAIHAFTDRCVAGIEADEKHCREAVERSLALATALAPIIGCDRAAGISKEAYQTGRTVREVAAEWGVLSPEELDAVLDAYRMTQPGV
jgi:fumarate hydratase class II